MPPDESSATPQSLSAPVQGSSASGSTETTVTSSAPSEQEAPIHLPPLSPRSPVPSPGPQKTVLDAVLALAVVAFGFLLVSFPARNSDLWLRLATGKLLAEGKSAFATDPFSYVGTADSWVNASWLFDLGAYGAYRVFGGASLVVLKALLVALLAGVLVRLGRRIPGHWLPVLSAALAVLALAPWLQVQPLTVSCLFLALTLLLLDRPHRLTFRQTEQGTPTQTAVSFRSYWLLVPLFALWANVDSWFLLGPVVVALYLLGQLLESRAAGQSARVLPGELRALTLTLVAGLAACCLNPSHLRVFALPASLGLSDTVRALGTERLFGVGGASPFQTSYFQSALGLTPAGLAYFVVTALGLLSFLANRRGLRFWRVLLFAGFFLLSAYQAQNIPFFAVVAAPVLALNFQEAAANRQAVGRHAPDVRGLALMVAVLALVAAWPGWLLPGPFQPRSWTVEPDPSLRELGEQLAQWHQEGKLGPQTHSLSSSPVVADELAWFCPAEKGFADSRLSLPANAAADYASLLRTVFGNSADSTGGWRDRLRERKIDRLILFNSNAGRTATALRKFLAAPQEWPLLSVAGKTAVFGWRDPAAANPQTMKPLDLNRSAFNPPPDRQAPRDWPGREPRPYTLLDAFTRPRAPGSADRDEASFWLLMWDMQQPRFDPRVHIVNWDCTQLTGLLGLLAAGEGPLLPGARAWGSSLLAVRLRSGYLVAQEDGTPLLLLAIRAARRALQRDPDDPYTYLVLGKAYLHLRSDTKEGIWGSGFPLLKDLRQVQIITALKQALTLKPDLREAHLDLVTIYQQMGYLDLARDHLQQFVDLLQAAGPLPGETAQEFTSRIDPLKQALARQEEDVQKREKLYAANSANLKVYHRARLAKNHGLAGKALALLLASDVSAFGVKGTDLELRLLLDTGRVKDVREWLIPEYKDELGTDAYGQLRTELLAATGDYDRADQQLEQWADVTASSPTSPAMKSHRTEMLVATTKMVLSGGPADALGPALVRAAPTLPPALGLILFTTEGQRKRANLTVIRGMLDLESGRAEEAMACVREALAIWEVPQGPGKGLDFGLRGLAQRVLQQLKKAGVS